MLHHLMQSYLAKLTFDPKHEHILHQMLADNPTAQAGKMFGYPAYKVNDKLAVGLCDTGIIIKVGSKRVKELVGQDGIQNFEPMAGRVWKDWILLTGNFEQHQSLFEEAIRYVFEETNHERTYL